MDELSASIRNSSIRVLAAELAHGTATAQVLARLDELLIEIPPVQERVLDAAVVEGVEDVGDVAGVDVA